MKFASILIAIALASCVTTVAPDGTKTTSFAPSVDQISATEGLVNAVKSRQASLPNYGPVYGTK